MNEGYEVMYICAGCGEHSFFVRFREPGENIVHYIEQVVRPALGQHHQKQRCSETKCDIKLPILPGAETVGEPARQ